MSPSHIANTITHPTIEKLPIDGLYLIHDFLSVKEEQELLQRFNEAEWSGNGIGPNPELKRRTQQYGYIFSYRYRRIMSHLGPLPEYTDYIIVRLNELNVPSDSVSFDSLIVNEYRPGQGIMPHCDAPSIFGPVILSLSLLSPCLMSFDHTNDTTLPRQDVYLPPRSLLVMTGSGRFDYKHSISKDLTESWNGKEFLRDTRVSLTFRSVVDKDAVACGK
ncbi:hypothetical protein BKA69DRAFT_1055736 [Paraphysoderma sedebokerense]|nr:hypothetical protein BKA69DRAFT_1055736 [Paraphysoderma sedebokerense]